MGQENQEVTRYSVIYSSPSQARWDAEQIDPYHVFHREVYAEFFRGKSGGKSIFTPVEAQLFSLMARDSEVYRNQFATLSAIVAKQGILDFAADVASTIASFYKRPTRFSEAQELLPRARQNPVFLENILIGLIAADPKSAFALLEQISEEEKPAVNIVDEEDSLALASLVTVGMLDNIEASSQPQDSRKTAMAKLLRTHLLQFEHVAGAAESQRQLRNLIKTNFIARKLWGEKVLPYPGVPDLADNTISYYLEQYGFARIKGFEWKEIIEIKRPAAGSRSRRKSPIDTKDPLS